MATTQSISKHVFLEYQEYQRLLDAKARCEQLSVKIKEMEKELEHLKSPKNMDGSGNLSGILARKEQEEQIKTPLVDITDSITMPPSADLTEPQAPLTTPRPWYFLGIPRAK